MTEPNQDSSGTSLHPRTGPQGLLALLLGQWFGTGRSPLAPGTVGSLGALPLFYWLRESPPLVYLAATVAVAGAGFWASERCSELLGDKDPSSVVIDEVAGVLIALGMVRDGSITILALAWLLFRLLDIKKPWLIDRVQHLKPNGVGIMADDLLAGAVAGVVSWAVSRLLPHL